MSEKMQQTTTVKEVDVNLDEIFNGAPGADSVVTPETKKPNVFSKPEKVDLSFLDGKEEPKAEEVKENTNEEAKQEEVKTETKETTVEEKVSKDEVDEILNEGLDLAEKEDEKSTASGRRRMSDMTDVFKKMIEDEQIIPFDDDKNFDLMRSSNFAQRLVCIDKENFYKLIF